MDFTDAFCLSSQILVLRFQVPTLHSSSGRCLSAATALPLSTVQSAIGHPAVYTQGLWACPAHVPPVLPLLWPPASACRPRDTLVICYFPSRGQRPPAWNNPQIPIWGDVLHIDMGLSDPLKGALLLHKGLWAIHIQSNPVSHKFAFTYELLVLT